MARPCYASDLEARLLSGAGVVLVVLAVHDWQAGRLEDRAGVFRLVIHPDRPAAEADLGILRGLDVLVVGGDPAEFYAAVARALLAGAQSVWGQFDDGVMRLDLWPTAPFLMGFDRVDDADALLDVLPNRRTVQAILGEGCFAASEYRAMRIAAVRQVLGDDVADKIAARLA